MIGEAPWTKLFELTTNIDIKRLATVGPEFALQQSKNSNNEFWQDVFKAWHTIFCQKIPSNSEQLLSEPIWFNPKLSKETLYFPHWYRSGITTLFDIIDSSGKILTAEKLQEKYSPERINF